MRLVRHPDDFVVLVRGSRSDAEALFSGITEVLQPIGLALSPEKTKVVSIVRRLMPGWIIQSEGIPLFQPSRVHVIRYRYRGQRHS